MCASGNQVQVMDMLKGVTPPIGSLVDQTGKQLDTRVERTGEFATDPMIGIDEAHVDRVRQQRAREAGGAAITGPVSL